MLSTKFTEESSVYVNPIQEVPVRLSVYSINRCEDQVIGFEFVKDQNQLIGRCCNGLFINTCIPIPTITGIVAESAEFVATDDPCYKQHLIKKNTEPSLVIERDADSKITGIMVRFTSKETCCLPLKLAYKLYLYDSNGCKFSVSRGLLLIK